MISFGRQRAVGVGFVFARGTRRQLGIAGAQGEHGATTLRAHAAGSTFEGPPALGRARHVLCFARQAPGRSGGACDPFVTLWPASLNRTPQGLAAPFGDLARAS